LLKSSFAKHVMPIYMWTLPTGEKIKLTISYSIPVEFDN